MAMSISIDYLGLNEIAALQKVIYDARDRAIVTLFLATGIFLNELVELTITDIDLTQKTIKITGKRGREIALNDQAIDALNNWLKARPDSNITNLFITTKGQAKRLSARSVDNLIRKYAGEAGLKRKVNAQILRSTFAVKLFQQNIPTTQATAILGISDPESIRRYINAEKVILTAQTAQKLNELDTRSTASKLITKLFPAKLISKKKETDIQIPMIANPEETIFGREHEIAEIRRILNNKHSVLITGKIGVGQTHLLKYIANHYNQANLQTKPIYIATPTPSKQCLKEIYQAIDPEDASKLPQRIAVNDLLDLIITKKDRLSSNSIIIIDQLDKVRLSDLDIFLNLAEHFTILSA